MDAPLLVFETTPVPGVPVEIVQYLLSLPDEVRQGFGSFLLDSTVDGFDGTPETSARLWRDELQRRCDDATARPERLLTIEEVMRNLRDHLAQLRRTPYLTHLTGYNCYDYFTGGWAERGHYDEASRTWVVLPLSELRPEQRAGFFAVGRAGVDGILFGYRYGHRGVWALYPVDQEFKHLAPNLSEFVQGWWAGTITV
ncbi:MAG: hypothetical protein K2X87_26760 [Gemmataceae bacterium]|nr:hypothetical protein [Gemmataceae bacterium]